MGRPGEFDIPNREDFPAASSAYGNFTSRNSFGRRALDGQRDVFGHSLDLEDAP